MKFPKYLSVFWALLLHFVYGDYADGHLRVGDTYKDPIKSNDAYSIYQLPSGTSIEGITYNNDSTGTFMLSFYVCPQDYLCTSKDTSQFIIKMDMNQIKILSKHELKTSSHFADNKVIPFRPDSRGYVYVLGEEKFIYKIHLEDSKIVDRFPRTEGGFDPTINKEERIVRGEIDEVNDRLFLSLQNSTILKLSLWDFKQDSVVTLSDSIEPISIQNEFAINKKTSNLYVVARFKNQVERTRCTIFESKEEFINNYQKERFSNEIPRSAESLKSLFTDEDSDYIYAIFVDTPSNDDREKKNMTLYQIKTSNLNITSEVSFDSREYMGNFFSKTRDYLYIFTTGGELLRFALKDNSLKWDKMTFVTIGHDKRAYDPTYMPSLKAAKAFDDHIAYIGAKSGIFIRVNLTNFCSDEFECDPFPKWTFPLIGIIFCSIIIAGMGWWFISYQFNKRKEYRSRIRFIDVMAENDKLPSTPSTPLSKRDYGAINI
eukprot:TRINITY_DN2968_c0_g1_i1.p1 TRINITY_DN2968_c0_g1~~TRINITY_DN2968_c0_g1_i1.p1  ORF type:complete len:487 (-),score=113.22 TRINITY_DN2968_c0_g1_i1:158-1618(-)